MNQSEMVVVFSRMIEGELSPEEFLGLEKNLLESDEWRQAYLEFIDLHNLLDLTSAPAVASDRVVSMKEVIRHQQVKAVRVALIAAAAVLMIGAVALRFVMMDPASEGESTLALEVSPDTIFSLVHPDDAPADLERMTMVVGSRLLVDQGAVYLRLESGVRSVVLGPAELTVRSESELEMVDGLGWFHVPDGAEGFSVVTGDLKVVDLGTEFGIDADRDDSSEVHVMTGEVEVTMLNDEDSVTRVSAGEALVVVDGQGLRPADYAGGRFLTDLPSGLTYVHWSFDHEQDGVFTADGSHPDWSYADAVRASGDHVGHSAAGVFGSALRFDGTKGQQLVTRLRGIGDDRPRTTACWVRTDYAPHWGDGGDIAGVIGWGYCQDDYAPHYSHTSWVMGLVRNGALWASGGCDYLAPPDLADGQWHHVACVMRPSGNPETIGGLDVTMYIDGVRQGRVIDAQLKSSPSHTRTMIHHPKSTPVTIGSSIHQPGTPPIVFRGEIDEMYLFYGALDDEAILRLMDQNDPRPPE